LIDEICAILLYSEERATFIDNLHDFINIRRDLLRKIREGSYFEEVEWAVHKGYSRKDEMAELRIFALQLFNLTQHLIVERL
jgi:hypothetical protein